MAIAHVCLRCGQGMTYARPQRELHYGLRIVRCASCGWAGVRRRAPATVAWHRAQRAGGLILLLAMKICITLMMLLGTVGSLIAFVFDGLEAHVVILVLQHGVLPLGVGAWLTAAFWYLPRPRVLAAWMALVLLVLTLFAIGLGLTETAATTPIESDRVGILFARAWSGIAAVMPEVAAMMTWYILVMTAGIPIGVGLGRIHGMTRSSSFRRRLRNARLRRRS